MSVKHPFDTMYFERFVEESIKKYVMDEMPTQLRYIRERYDELEKMKMKDLKLKLHHMMTNEPPAGKILVPSYVINKWTMAWLIFYLELQFPNAGKNGEFVDYYYMKSICRNDYPTHLREWSGDYNRCKQMIRYLAYDVWVTGGKNPPTIPPEHITQEIKERIEDTRQRALRFV
jgi:hypothetical protein